MLAAVALSADSAPGTPWVFGVYPLVSTFPMPKAAVVPSMLRWMYVDSRACSEGRTWKRWMIAG